MKPRLALLVFLLCALFTPLSDVRAAGEDLPAVVEARAAQFAPGGVGRSAPLAPLPASGAASAAPDDDTILRQWSRIAFQSYRDGNWEIYSARPDGQDLRRLTNDPAADGRVTQSPSGDRIAFVSDRAGNFDIYTARTDGSDVRRLTDDPAEDNYPSFSPDGRQIAFASNRAGTWDILVMNADGTGVRTLVGGPLMDYDPAWSPDGEWIAWIRMGEYYKYHGDVRKVRPSGADDQRVAVHHLFLENLAWSADSQSIGFDEDRNNDGFTEIAHAVPHENGTFLYTIHTPAAPLTDALMGGFAPDGSKFLVAEAHYIQQGEEYLLASAGLGQKRTDASEGAPLEPMPGSGMDMLGEWQRTESVAPVTEVLPVPRLTRYGTELALKWRTTEMGAGVASYDVEFLAPGGEWYRKYTGITEESASIQLWVGGTVKFRVRGRDVLNNVERWPRYYDAETYAYVGRAQGYVYDVRGVPIPGAAIGQLQNPPQPFVTAADGSYDAYCPWDIEYLNATHPAYGPVVAIFRPSEQDRLDMALPPKKNAVTNGGFEDQLKGWKVLSGGPHTAGYMDTHSGMSGLMLYHETGPVAGRYAVGQMLNVPADAERPTLSFFVLRQAAQRPEALLSVTMGLEGETPKPLTLNWMHAGAFAHVWADLSEWRGKQDVILTFQTDLNGSEPARGLIVDDVVIGDWTTPRVDAVEGERELPGMLVVRGDNFRPGAQVRIGSVSMPATIVDRETIRIPVGTGGPVGVQWLRVTNPGGEQAQHRLVLGAPLFLPLIGKGD